MGKDGRGERQDWQKRNSVCGWRWILQEWHWDICMRRPLTSTWMTSQHCLPPGRAAPWVGTWLTSLWTQQKEAGVRRPSLFMVTRISSGAAGGRVWLPLAPEDIMATATVLNTNQWHHGSSKCYRCAFLINKIKRIYNANVISDQCLQLLVYKEPNMIALGFCKANTMPTIYQLLQMLFPKCTAFEQRQREKT